MPVTATTITTNEARLSYLHVFQPYAQQQNQEPKYSLTVLVPKSDQATKAAIDAAVRAAMDQGVTNCWNGIRPPQPAICVHDGDGPRPSDGQPFGEECRGHWVFTASSKQQPFVVDANVQPIINQADVYSGCYGRVCVNFFPYNSNGKKGVGCGLNGVQKLRDGEPLGGRVSVEEAFGAAAAPAAPAYGAPGYAPAAPAYGAPGYAPAAPAPAYGAPTTTTVYGAPPAHWGQPTPGQINPLTGQPL